MGLPLAVVAGADAGLVVATGGVAFADPFFGLVVAAVAALTFGTGFSGGTFLTSFGATVGLRLVTFAWAAGFLAPLPLCGATLPLTVLATGFRATAFLITGFGGFRAVFLAAIDGRAVFFAPPVGRDVRATVLPGRATLRAPVLARADFLGVDFADLVGLRAMFGSRLVRSFDERGASCGNSAKAERKDKGATFHYNSGLALVAVQL